ncbi:MAG: nitrilase-related carbon-nitrogen hydrolase [Gemmatimonadota bacterium]|nr:carbon-nitrogen hydrolase [Chloroflexota bacterium]
MDPLPVALAQTAPLLGAVDANVAELERVLEDARRAGAELVVFPELALTGYALRDAVADVALPRGERLEAIAALGRGLAFTAGFVEQGSDGAFYNAALVAVDGRVAAVHRKRHLPTYGLFDEGRFFKAGASATLVDARGWRLGVLVCEEAWYPRTVDEIATTGGAEALLVLANGPGRGVQGGTRWQSQDAWLDLVRYYARTYSVPVLLVNRTGVEEGLFFGGCSALVDPGGRVAAEAPVFEPALLLGELSRAALRRARLRNHGRPLAPPQPDPTMFPPTAAHGFA